MVSWIAPLSTGCGETSTNVWCPEAAGPGSLPRNRTVWRTLAYQYPASSSVPSIHSHVTVE